MGILPMWYSKAVRDMMCKIFEPLVEHIMPHLVESLSCMSRNAANLYCMIWLPMDKDPSLSECYVSIVAFDVVPGTHHHRHLLDFDCVRAQWEPAAALSRHRYCCYRCWCYYCSIACFHFTILHDVACTQKLARSKGEEIRGKRDRVWHVIGCFCIFSSQMMLVWRLLALIGPAPKQRSPKNIDVNTSDVSVQFQGFRALSLHHQKLKVSEKCQGMSMPEMIGLRSLIA